MVPGTLIRPIAIESLCFGKRELWKDPTRYRYIRQCFRSELGVIIAKGLFNDHDTQQAIDMSFVLFAGKKKCLGWIMSCDIEEIR